MTVWDCLMLAVTLALVAGGIWKGALRLAFGLSGLLLAFFYAGRFAPGMAGWIPFVPAGAKETVAAVAGFTLILLLFALGGILASRLAKAAGLSLLNRLLGGILGLVLSAYLAGGLVMLAERGTPAFKEKVRRGPVVRTLAAWAVGIEALLPLPSPTTLLPNAAPPPAEQNQAKPEQPKGGTT